MGKIVAIGGGASQTSRYYKELLILCEKKKPKASIIIAASNDEIKDYVATDIEGLKKQGFKIKIIRLVKDETKTASLNSELLDSNLIFITGGRTSRLMATLKKTKIDKIIRKAFAKDIILAGSSAGGKYLFRYSNSRVFKNGDERPILKRISGLGFVKATLCPHYNTEDDVKVSLKEMMKKTPDTAIAIDECCAIAILDDKYKIISGNGRANAYKTFWKDGKYHSERLPKDNKLRPVREILAK